MIKSDYQAPGDSINIFNRYLNKIDEEQIYGENSLKFIYKTSLGKYLFPFITGPLFSKFYGQIQNSVHSRKKILPFIRKFNIDMDEYLPGNYPDASIPYSNFNDFFIRKFKPGKRSFTEKMDQMGAFAEGRYFAYNKIDQEVLYPVKGKYLIPSLMLNNKKWEQVFENGPLIIARLCPTDYHRFHFPDSGHLLDFYKVKGKLYSVNPFALKHKQDIFLINERHVSILETKNFGKIAYIEVGATCVGKIKQTFNQEKPFFKGEEKGYFLFGGSTVIIIGEKGKWAPEKDLLRMTSRGIETFLKLGDVIASLS